MATSHLVLTFDEITRVGTGTLAIKRTSNDSIVETLTLSGALLSGNGSTQLTLNPVTTLSGSTSYYITWTANAFKDAVFATHLPAQTSTTYWNFTTTDTTAPVLAQVTPVSTPTNDSTPTYTFSSTEAGTISYGGDCSSSTTVASVGNNTVTFSSLSDGAHSNCTVTVTDSASNASAALAVTPFTVDTSAPSAPGTPDLETSSDTGSSSTDNVTRDTTPTFTISCVTSSTVTLLSGATVLGSDTCALSTVSITSSTLSSNGVYIVKARQTDLAGNASSDSPTLSITLDFSAPVLAEVTPVPTPTTDATPNYTFSSTQAGSITYGGDCSSATSSASVGSNTVNFSSLSDGAHSNCTVTVTDAAGNVSSSRSVTAFTVDTNTPDVSSLSPADGATGISTTANLVITFDETVTAVTGKNVTIKRSGDDSTVEVVAADSGLVSIAGNAVTVDPSGTLADGTEYYVLVDAGAFIDGADNTYTGIGSATYWNFTTSATASSSASTSPEASSAASSAAATGGGAGGRRGNATVRTPREAVGSSQASSAVGTRSPSSSNRSESSAPAAPGVFCDVPEQTWYSESVEDLVDRGIIEGERDVSGMRTGMFRPERPVSIAELVKDRRCSYQGTSPAARLKMFPHKVTGLLRMSPRANGWGFRCSRT